MSTFRIPTFTELRQLFIDLIRSLIPEAALQVGEDYEREANILAGVGQSLMGPLTTIEDQIFPDTANDANVALHGELENLPRKQPSTASGLALLLGTTTAGAVQPSGSTATSQTGVSVFLTGPATTILPGWPQARILSIPALDTLVVSGTAGMSTGDTFDLGGSIYVVRDLPGGGAVVIYGTLETVPILRDLYPIYITPALAAIAAIEASSEGAAGNLSFGSVLTLDNPASGISPTGRVMVLADGSDLETFREWGRRIRNHRRVKPRDANAAAQREWQENIVGVARGFCYPLFRGLGTTDDVPQGVAGARHLSPTKRSAIQADIAPAFPLQGRVPTGGHDVAVTDFTDYYVDLDITLIAGAGYGPDWGPVARNGYYQGSSGTFLSLYTTILRFRIDRTHEFLVTFSVLEVDATTTAQRIQSADPTKIFFSTSVVGGQVRITSSSTAFESSVEIVTPNAAAGFALLGFGVRGGTMVVGFGSTVSRINTTIDPLNMLVERQRVLILIGDKFIEQREVISVDSAGFVVSPALPAVPIVGTLIYPGSSLIEPVRDLLLAMVEDLGPGDTNPPSRFPPPSEEFPSDLTLNLIHSTVRKAKGVVDVLINSPRETVKPPPKAQIKLSSLVLRYYS